MPVLHPLPCLRAHRHTKKSKIFSKKLQKAAKSCKILQKVARFRTFRALFSTLSAFSHTFVHVLNPHHLAHFTKNPPLLLPRHALLCRFFPCLQPSRPQLPPAAPPPPPHPEPPPQPLTQTPVSPSADTSERMAQQPSSLQAESMSSCSLMMPSRSSRLPASQQAHSHKSASPSILPRIFIPMI